MIKKERKVLGVPTDVRKPWNVDDEEEKKR